jgi:hypothetical protein
MGHILPAERRKIQGGWWGGGGGTIRENSKGYVVFVFEEFYVVTVLDYGVLIAYTLYVYPPTQALHTSNVNQGLPTGPIHIILESLGDE